MEMEMYCVYDRQTREYGQILWAQGIGAAIRAFKSGIKNTGSLMDKYPEDFDLVRVGNFNTTTGEITAEGRPVVVGSLLQVLEDHARP